jgi:hypothetical protein
LKLNKMARKKNIKFGVFCNQMIGHLRTAATVAEAIDALPKRVKKCWSNIMYKDEEGRTINIPRDFLEEQGMSIDEIIADCIEHGNIEDNILILNPKGSGTIDLNAKEA